MLTSIVASALQHWVATSACLALLGLFLVLLKGLDFQRKGEAPLVGGLIPFLGAAIELGRQGFPATLNKYAAKFGDVFTLTLLGKRMTFVGNAHMIPLLGKLEARGLLSNFPTRFEIIPMLFGDGECRKDVLERFWSSSETTHVWSLFHGRNLEPLTLGFQNELISRIETLVPKAEFKDGHLLNLIANLFLPSTTRLFFGNNPFFQSQEYIDTLLTFNDHVNALQKGLRPNSIPAFLESKRTLIKAILAESDAPNFEAVQALFNGMDNAGFNDNEKATTVLPILWASNMNAIVSSFWALYYILNDPAAMAAISKEIHEVLATSPPSGDGMPTFNMSQLRELNITESACLEAMRISSANLLRTEATEDFVMETAKGDFNIRKGDNVVVSSGQFHYDSELFPDPTTFKYNRFSKDPITQEPPVFMKDGQKCNAGILVFAHGKHKCPGRFLALNELKLLMLYVFTRVEIQIVDSTKPQLDETYYGVGSMKPKEDLRIRYRFRSTEA